MSVLATVLLLALSRAELIARMKAPIITQADGMVRVYADCPEDMRREYQTPVARFAAETMKALDRHYKRVSARVAEPVLVIHLGEKRTNDTSVVVRAVTNDTRVLTRIFLPSPGFTDLQRLRTEVVLAYHRGIRHEEVSPEVADRTYLLSDPTMRIACERRELEEFIVRGKGEHEHGLELMRKIVEPGKATRRDVLIFASRLFLYPPQYGQLFAERYSKLSFREAMDCVKIDPRVRIVAFVKAREMPLYGGGRGPLMQRAAYAYMDFLLALAEGKCEERELKEFLEKADGLLNQAYEQCVE